MQQLNDGFSGDQEEQVERERMALAHDPPTNWRCAQPTQRCPVGDSGTGKVFVTTRT